MGAAPPAVRLPTIAQTLGILVSVDRYPKFVLDRYGPVISMRAIGLGELVAIAEVDAIKRIFTTDRDRVSAGEANAQVIGILGPGSVMALDGDRHLRLRRLLLPPFHGDAVRAYAELVEEIAAAEVDSWPIGKPFPIHRRTQAIALEVILRAVIGVRDRARLDELRSLLPRVLEVNPIVIAAEATHDDFPDTAIGRRLPWIRARRRAEALLREEIAAHRAEPEGRDDVLALLVAARDEEGRGFTDEELGDQLLTLLLAGHETTATALAWAFERVVRTPKALARLEREVPAGEGGDYIDAVVNETLRVRPVLDVVWRKLDEPMQVGSYRLPAGTIVTPSIRGVHGTRYDDPEEFRPERFLGHAPEPYTLIPFGGGPRRCIGASFALMEMRTVLRAVFERVRLRAPSARPERQSRMRSFTTVPARGARVVVTSRRAPTRSETPRSA